MYWECGEIICSEDGSEHRIPFPTITDREPLQQWVRLVVGYARCSLTRPTDRLPALSGLATKFAEVIKADYMAGMWAEDLLYQLLWKRDKTWPRAPEVLEYIAPTWSWASAQGGVTFTVSGHTCPRSKEKTDLAKVVSHDLKRASLDPFGALTGGWLTISAPLIALSLQLRVDVQKSTWLKSWNGAGHDCFYRMSFMLNYEHGIRVSLDREQGNKEPLFALFLLRRRSWDGSNDYWKHEGLTLARSGSIKDSYRRAGMFSSGIEESGPEPMFGLDNPDVGMRYLERKTVTLV